MTSLYYKIPFPVAMDKIIKMPKQISNEMIEDFIEIYFSEYKPSLKKIKKN